MHLFLETTSAGGGMGSMIIMMVAVVAVMYFLMIRPENKKKKEAEQMRSAVRPARTGFGWSLPNGRFLPTRPRTRRRRLQPRRPLRPESAPRRRRKPLRADPLPRREPAGVSACGNTGICMRFYSCFTKRLQNLS